MAEEGEERREEGRRGNNRKKRNKNREVEYLGTVIEAW